MPTKKIAANAIGFTAHRMVKWFFAQGSLVLLRLPVIKINYQISDWCSKSLVKVNPKPI